MQNATHFPSYRLFDAQSPDSSRLRYRCITRETARLRGTLLNVRNHWSVLCPSRPSRLSMACLDPGIFDMLIFAWTPASWNPWPAVHWYLTLAAKGMNL